MTFLLALVLAAGMRTHAQAPGTMGTIAGCVTDTMSERVPGATVVVRSRDVRRTTVADASGCYEFEELPPNSYRVTARLAGFDNVTRDRLRVEAARVTRLDFLLHISAICECIRIGGTLLQLACDFSLIGSFEGIRCGLVFPRPGLHPLGLATHAGNALFVLCRFDLVTRHST